MSHGLEKQIELMRNRWMKVPTINFREDKLKEMVIEDLNDLLVYEFKRKEEEKKA